MNINDQKEAFSEAYARAIASVAGFMCSKQDRDRDSIDISFKSIISPFVIIEAQLKSTSRADAVADNKIRFPLSIKNYNDLRAQTIMPRILVILILPDKLTDQVTEQPEQWINQTPDDEHIFKPAVLGCLADQIISLREETNNAG